jgi:terminase small subunit-like protein
MVEDGEAAPGAGSGRGRFARRQAPVKWSLELAVTLCRRVAAGELVYAICREPGMPTPEGIKTWTQKHPDFAEALDAAKRAGGRPPGRRGGVSTYCQASADAIFDRLCEGESLTRIGRDPTMPSLSTIFYWRRRRPEFDDMVRLGKEIQAERLSDEGWDMVQAATPETAYLTHVRLSHLRWMTGVMAPKVYRLKQVEPAVGRQEQKVLYRHFEIEVDAATGQRRVVSWCPNPETGEAQREDAPGWRLPPGATRLPG